MQELLETDEVGYIKVDAKFRCCLKSQSNLAYPQHSNVVFAIGDCCLTPNRLKHFSYNAIKSAEYLADLLLEIDSGKFNDKTKDFKDTDQPFAVVVNLGSAFIQVTKKSHSFMLVGGLMKAGIRKVTLGTLQNKVMPKIVDRVKSKIFQLLY